MLTDQIDAQPSLAEQERDSIAELNHAQWLALENVRMLASRNRKEEWAQHMLRFCAEAGNAARILRAQPDPARTVRKPMTDEQIDVVRLDLGYAAGMTRFTKIVRAVEHFHKIKDAP